MTEVEWLATDDLIALYEQGPVEADYRRIYLLVVSFVRLY